MQHIFLDLLNIPPWLLLLFLCLVHCKQRREKCDRTQKAFDYIDYYIIFFSNEMNLSLNPKSHYMDIIFKT